jgi:hypothetical protein
MKVVQVRCPHCSNPIKMKQKDLLFYCDSCKTMHVRDGGVTVVDYEIGDFGRGAPQGDRVYVPFWRLYCSFTIQNVKIEGGGFYKLSNWLKGGTGTSGDIFIFVPASDFDPATFKRLAIANHHDQGGSDSNGTFCGHHHGSGEARDPAGPGLLAPGQRCPCRIPAFLDLPARLSARTLSRSEEVKRGDSVGQPPQSPFKESDLAA